jgi:hypothetical protein
VTSDVLLIGERATVRIAGRDQGAEHHAALAASVAYSSYSTTTLTRH